MDHGERFAAACQIAQEMSNTLQAAHPDQRTYIIRTVIDSFDWESSPEGFAFWEGVYDATDPTD